MLYMWFRKDTKPKNKDIVRLESADMTCTQWNIVNVWHHTDMILFSIEMKLYFLLFFIAESSYQKWKDAHVPKKKHSMFCGDMHLSLHLLK